MKVDGDDVIRSGDAQHVRNQLCCDRGSCLLLRVLPRIRIARNDGRDSGSGSDLASVYHDEELHHVVVHFSAAALDDEDIRTPDAFVDFNAETSKFT